MKISYVVTVHNEGESFSKIMDQLLSLEGDQEIIILDDYSDDLVTMDAIQYYKNTFGITVVQHKLDGDFAAHRNYVSGVATGKYIFQIDADEILGYKLLNVLPLMIENNPDIDIIYIPRVNIVRGITDKDITRWQWKLNEQEWIQWPDYQARIYKNSDRIFWINKVHETLTSDETRAVSMLPAEEEWALMHVKDIERQRAQNEFYESL